MFQRSNIQIIGQHCDANFSIDMPLLNLAEIAADSIRIDLRYFGHENFVGTRDSWTHYQFTFFLKFLVAVLRVKAHESLV